MRNPPVPNALKPCSPAPDPPRSNPYNHHCSTHHLPDFSYHNSTFDDGNSPTADIDCQLHRNAALACFTGGACELSSHLWLLQKG